MITARGIAGIVVAITLWFAAPGSAETWKVQPSPGSGVLNSVACAAPTACIAVGLVGSPAGPGSILAERWDGRRWSVQREVHPHWLGQSEWTDVSCSGRRFCIAVGEVVFSSSFSGRVRSIIGIWRGGSWDVSFPRDGGPGANISFEDALGLVSCVSADFCAAGGWGLTSRLPPGSAPSARRWNGSRWLVMPAAHGVAPPASVWCANPRACLGISGDSFERWDGKRWSRAGQLPGVGDFESGFWGGLACRSMVSCIDVGQGFPGGDANAVSLVGEWNGRAWALNIPGETEESSTINWGPSSCTAALGCLVLGSNANPAPPPMPTPEQSKLWTGSRWTAFPAPVDTLTPAPSPTQVNGVSCVEQTCTAVGWTGSSTVRTLIERYA